MKKSYQLDVPLLKTISEIPGAPGFEDKLRNYLKKELKNIVDEMHTDNMGNLVCIKKGKSSKNKIMSAAHMDEISFIVTHVDSNGFLRIHPLGGFDPKTLTSQRVIVHGKKDIIGVFSCKPIHVMTPEERAKKLKVGDFFIDTGLEAAEVKKLVRVGTPITRERGLIEMGDCVNGKSLDNRVSVYILLETLKELKNKKIPYDFYAVFTVQEEIGIRGAKVAAQEIQPDFAICLDTTIANDTPGAAAHEKITELGKGTAIKIMDSSVVCDIRMTAFLESCAKKAKIPHQFEILTGGGTDTAGMQLFTAGGSIAGAISIPTRNIHQTVEMSHGKDIRASIDLMKAAVSKMDTHNWKRS